MIIEYAKRPRQSSRSINFVRLGRNGYTYVMWQMHQNARALAANLREGGRFEVIGDGREQLPLVAFRLSGSTGRTTSPTSRTAAPHSIKGWHRPSGAPAVQGGDRAPTPPEDVLRESRRSKVLRVDRLRTC